MLDALFKRNWTTAEHLANRLLEIMKQTGVAPQTTVKTMRRAWDRAIAEFGCMVCLQQVNEARRRRARKGK